VLKKGTPDGVRKLDSTLATFEVLADRELTDRLLKLSKTIDADVRAGRLLRTAEVFGDASAKIQPI
jgi:hypothetical protein